MRRRGVERIVEQEEADVIKRVVSETRPGGNGYPYSYNLLRFQGVDRSSCLRNTRCILIIRTSMTVRALNYRAATISKSLSLSLLSSSSRPLQRGREKIAETVDAFIRRSPPPFSFCYYCYYF